MVACGPPLTDPSSLNITGSWTTSDNVGPLHDIVMNIIQIADGTIKGDWSGTLIPPDAACPAGLPASPSGPVTGSYNVVGIGLNVLGIGFFHGQKISPTEMRGDFQSCGSFYSVTFTLTSPIPGG